MALAVKPAGAVDPDKRLARLREVREQERRIAASTRASFKTAVRDREEELARERSLASTGLTKPASASLAAALHHASVNVGAAHSAARAERDILRLEAAEGAAAWHDGVERAERRAAGALFDVHAQTAAKKASREALLSRRELVARTEAARSTAAVEHARSLEAHQLLSDRDQAAAAAARVAGPQATISRGLTPVDFASTRLHGAAEIAARTPRSVSGQVTVHRHAAMDNWQDSPRPSYAGGPSASELARAEAERQKSLLEQQRQERAEAERLTALRGQKALARLRTDKVNAQLLQQLDTLDKTNRAHMIAQLVPALRPPPPLWSAPPARVAVGGSVSVATFASATTLGQSEPPVASAIARGAAIPRETTFNHQADQRRVEEALGSALRLHGMQAAGAAPKPVLRPGGACAASLNAAPADESSAVSHSRTRAPVTTQQEIGTWAAAAGQQQRPDRFYHSCKELSGQQAMGAAEAGPESAWPNPHTNPRLNPPGHAGVEFLAISSMGGLQPETAEARIPGSDAVQSYLPRHQPSVSGPGRTAPVETCGGDELTASAATSDATHSEDARRYGELEQQVAAASSGLERVRHKAGHACGAGPHAPPAVAARAVALPPSAGGQAAALRNDRMSSELRHSFAEERAEPEERATEGPIDRHAAFVARFEAVSTGLRTASAAPPTPAAPAPRAADAKTPTSPQKMVNLLRADGAGATQPDNVPVVRQQCEPAAAHRAEAWAESTPAFGSETADERQTYQPRLQARPPRPVASAAPPPDFASDTEDDLQAHQTRVYSRVQPRPQRSVASAAPQPSRKPHHPPTRAVSLPAAAVPRSARAAVPAHAPSRNAKPAPPRFAAPKPEPPGRAAAEPGRFPAARRGRGDGASVADGQEPDAARAVPRKPAVCTKPGRERSAPARVSGEPRANGPPPPPTRVEETRSSRRVNARQREQTLEEELRPWPAMPSELPSPMPRFDPIWPEDETADGQPPTAPAGAAAPSTRPVRDTSRNPPHTRAQMALTRTQMAAARASAMPTYEPRVATRTRTAPADRAASAAPAALARARAASATAQRLPPSSPRAAGDATCGTDEEAQLSPTLPLSNIHDNSSQPLDSRRATASSVGLLSPSDGDSSSGSSSSFSPLISHVRLIDQTRHMRSERAPHPNAYSVRATNSQPADARAVNLGRSRSDLGAVSSSSSALSLLSDPLDAVAPHAYTLDPDEPSADAHDSCSGPHGRVWRGSSRARLGLSRSSSSDDDFGADAYNRSSAISGPGASSASSSSLDLHADGFPLAACASTTAACAYAYESDDQARSTGAAGLERSTGGAGLERETESGVAARGVGLDAVHPSASSSVRSRQEWPQEQQVERHDRPRTGRYSYNAEADEDSDFYEQMASWKAASACYARGDEVGAGGPAGDAGDSAQEQQDRPRTGRYSYNAEAEEDSDFYEQMASWKRYVHSDEVGAGGHGGNGGDTDAGELGEWGDDPMRPLSPDTAALLGLPPGCGMIEAVEWLSNAPSGNSPVPGRDAYTLLPHEATCRLPATRGEAGMAVGGGLVGTSAEPAFGAPTRCAVYEERRLVGSEFEDYGVGLHVAGQHISTARAVAMLGSEVGEDARLIDNLSSGLCARSGVGSEDMALPPSLEEVGIAETQRTAGYVHLAASAAQLGSE